jgi:hypothetical protein
MASAIKSFYFLSSSNDVISLFEASEGEDSYRVGRRFSVYRLSGSLQASVLQFAQWLSEYMPYFKKDHSWLIARLIIYSRLFSLRLYSAQDASADEPKQCRGDGDSESRIIGLHRPHQHGLTGHSPTLLIPLFHIHHIARQWNQADLAQTLRSLAA